jgi:hypothetical protein
MVRQDGLRPVHAQLGPTHNEVSVLHPPRFFMTTLLAGYGPLIRTYVQFLLAKLRFHRIRPEFNGLFEYEEYVTLKGIDDPNEGYV